MFSYRFMVCVNWCLVYLRTRSLTYREIKCGKVSKWIEKKNENEGVAERLGMGRCCVGWTKETWHITSGVVVFDEYVHRQRHDREKKKKRKKWKIMMVNPQAHYPLLSGSVVLHLYRKSSKCQIFFDSSFEPLICHSSSIPPLYFSYSDWSAPTTMPVWPHQPLSDLPLLLTGLKHHPFHFSFSPKNFTWDCHKIDLMDIFQISVLKCIS